MNEIENHKLFFNSLQPKNKNKCFAANVFDVDLI